MDWLTVLIFGPLLLLVAAKLLIAVLLMFPADKPKDVHDQSNP